MTKENNSSMLTKPQDPRDTEDSLEVKTNNWVNSISYLSLEQQAQAWLEHHKSVLAKRAAYHSKGLLVSLKLQAPHFPLLPKELQEKILQSELENNDL